MPSRPASSCRCATTAAQDDGEWPGTPLEPQAPRAPGPIDLNNQGRSWDNPRRAPAPPPPPRGLSSEEVEAESAKAAAAAVRSAYRVFKDHGAFMYQSRDVWVLRSDIEDQIKTCYDGPIPIEGMFEILLNEICELGFPYMDDGDGRRYYQLTSYGLNLLRAEYDRGC